MTYKEKLRWQHGGHEGNEIAELGEFDWAWAGSKNANSIELKPIRVLKQRM